MDSSVLIHIAKIIYLIILIGVIIKIIVDTDDPVKCLAYVLFVIVAPVIGIIFYFAVGVNYRKNKLYKKKLINDKALASRLKNDIDSSTQKIIARYNDLVEPYLPTVDMLLNDTHTPLAPCKDIKLLINGENKFPEVIKALENAKNHIHLEYYIYADDEIGNTIKDILIRKVKEGVKVRFMFDDFASHKLHKRLLKELQDNGVTTSAFYRVHFYAFANRLNYRNHRKIIVIDGNIGFIGGINVDDRYINKGKNKLYWRDTHLMITGPAVASLQYTFMNDWNFCTENQSDEIEFNQSYFQYDIDVNHQPEALAQITTSGPDSTNPSIMLSLLGIITDCKKRLYLTTPYFIPNETIIDALKYAALSGVDVRLLVPGKSDSVLVNLAACSYYGDLLNVGVRIYRYQKGFVHAKTIVADDNLSIIGSANTDLRSFDLNFEANANVFSREINQQLCDAFMNDLNDSTEINPEDWFKRNKFRKMAESIARLFSPLL